MKSISKDTKELHLRNTKFHTGRSRKRLLPSDLVEKNSESVGATIKNVVIDLVYIETKQEPNALQVSLRKTPIPDVHIEQGKTFNIVSGKFSEIPDKIKSVINNGE